MPPLDATLKASVQRMRTVLFFRALLQHLFAAATGLLLLTICDKIGILPFGEWRPARAGDWPLYSLPSAYRQVILWLLAAALLGAALRMRLATITTRHAALVLDEQLGLAERLVSAITSDRQQPMAAALVADAERCCQIVRPTEVFKWTPSALGYATLGEALACAAIIFFLPAADILGKRSHAQAQQKRAAEERKEVAAMAAALRQEAQRLVEARQGLADSDISEDFIKRLEALAKRLEQDRAIDAQQAQEMINRLQDEMRQIVQSEAQQAERLSGLQSPRDKRSLLKEMADKLRDQRPSEAAEAMQRLRRRLAKNELSQDDLARLSKDLGELAEQLEQQGLETLSKSCADLAEDLQDLQSDRNWQRLQKLQEQMAKALQDITGKNLDLAQLSEEEKELLRSLQKALAQMEITEDMMRQMEQALAEGKVRRLTAEDLRQMLEDMKRGQSGAQGDSGNSCAAAMVAVPMPGLGSSTAGSHQSHGERQAGPPGTAHVPTPLDPNAKETEISADAVRVRARQAATGHIVAQWLERGLPAEAEDVKSEYAATVAEAAESSEAKSEREAVPREERALIRDYLSRLRKAGE